MLKLHKFSSYLLALFLTIIFLAQFSNSYAKDRGIGRIRSCDANGWRENLDFDPTTAGKDVEFVMTNPLCLSVIAYSYVATKLAIARMNAQCQVGSPNVRYTPTPILDARDISRATVRAYTTRNPTCIAAVAGAATSYARSIAILGAIYEIARDVFDRAEICGSGWKSPNPRQYLINRDDYKAVIEGRVREYIDDPTLRSNLNFNNRDYREWYYGGVEVDDSHNNDSEMCLDVTKDQINGSYPPQTYYLKGYETGNFNCEKYDILPGQVDPRDGSVITSQRLAEFRQAYDCCIKRSENYVCIDYRGTKKFCRANSTCEIEDIYFQTRSRSNGSMICAQTYSLCPYNFNLGGGTEECDYFQDGNFNPTTDRFEYIRLVDVQAGNCANKSEIRNEDCTYNNKAGKCRNYCQYMRHCTKVNNLFRYRANLGSPYFSEACLNFVGDSRNRIEYGTGFIAGSARHFSAPIAQCVRETLENVFYNRAGHTKCMLEGDVPNSNRECQNGTAWRTGDQVKSRSFFTMLQDSLRFAIKLVLTLSVTFYGMKILLAMQEIKKAEMIMYVVKIGLIMFFALGAAWHTFFFDGVYKASTVFATMVFKIQMPSEEYKRDGCQFGVTTDAQGNPIATALTYPRGKEYLAIWDTLDCKIARYMGFGPEVSSANIAKLIIAGFITGPIGIYFSIALLFFAFLLISATIKALHIFLASSIAVILLIFISPITITCILFEKTKGIFTKWLAQLIGYSLQPMILFAYIAIFIAILDKTLIGSATFYGQPPTKTISCSEYCIDNQGNKVSEENSPDCDRIGEELVKPKSDSFACLVDANSFGKFPGLELIGISLPFILELFDGDVKKKILTIIKGAIIIFFLNKFMSEVPKIATQLVGGKGLSSGGPEANAIFKNVVGFMRGFQKRGQRLGKKAAGSSHKAAEGAARAVGDRGKSVGKGGGLTSDSGDEARNSNDGGGGGGGNAGNGGENQETGGPSDKESGASGDPKNSE